MTIIPNGVINRKITLKEKDLKNKVAQVNVFIGGGKKINLILDNEIVLRFDIKKEKDDHFLKKLKLATSKKFKLLDLKNNSILRNILIYEEEIRININKDKKDTISRNSSEGEDFINGIKRRGADIIKFGEKLDLDLAKSHKEFYCKRCNAFRPGPGLEKEKLICLKCHNLLTSKKITHLPDNVFSYLNGLWLEDYVADILNSTGWIAWSSPNLLVYGVSGHPHQIDVLGVKNGKILIVECKSGEFNPSHAKNMLAKYYDIRCHNALAVSLSEIHSIAEAMIKKNPAIQFCDKLNNIKKLKKIIEKL